MTEGAVRATLVAATLWLLSACVVEEPVAVQHPPPAPPPAQAEVVPAAPGPAAVWVPGYWAWHGPRRGYVWVPGMYAVPSQPAYDWVPAHWAQSPGGWVWVEGHWQPR